MYDRLISCQYHKGTLLNYLVRSGWQDVLLTVAMPGSGLLYWYITRDPTK